MPFNGSGVFTIVNTFVPNTTILSAAVNQNFTDIATGLSDCLTRDGQAGMTAAFKAISGALATPSITFTSDATSGLYLSASGVIGLVSHSLGMLLNTTLYSATSATVQAGGSGYAVGDTITMTGGTAVSQPVFTVATLSGSAVATVTVAYPGFYSVKPSNPVSQGSTSGIGSGCTLNVTYNDPSSSDYRAFFSDQAGDFLWQKFGASSYVSGLMKSADALTLAQGIGGSALATAIGGTLLLTPQGMLTPNNSVLFPWAITDYTAQTRIYWSPLNGNVIPIYNGTQFVLHTSAQIFCDLTAGNQATSGIYDVYAFLNSSTVTLGLSPSWSAGTAGSVTAGSCARGSGTGGTALAFVNGLYVNAAAMTVNNGATTYSVPVNQGTYLGSVWINGTAGQYNCYVSYGQGRVWGLWNCYNRRPILLKAGDPTANWNYSSATIRPSNNNSANSITVFTGLAMDYINTEFSQNVIGSSATPVATVEADWVTGIGWNSTTAFSGQRATSAILVSTSSGNNNSFMRATSTAHYEIPPVLGINVATSLESTTNIVGGGVFVQYSGTEPNMLLMATYPG